jgi:hypothetical protein
MCVLIFNTVFETFFILRRIQQDIIINVNMSSCKEPVTLVKFSSNLNFLDNFFKNTLNFLDNFFLNALNFLDNFFENTQI